MKRLVALGISIGVLAGLFTWIAGSLTEIGSLTAPLVAWVGFAAWAVFYAAGGRTAGLVSTLASTVSGLVWGWLILKATLGVSEAGAPAVLGLMVALGAFAMCVQAAVKPLAFIPGAFIGAACFFGNDGLFWATLISLVGGALLAYVSERLADVIEHALGGGTRARAAGERASA
ncbi:MAG: hypothetical protein JWQ53_2961 [Klenkia sp.]|nr:hypothetical protein [Klenkia sp.]